MKITVRCPVFPTEDTDRIKRILLGIFPNSTFNSETGERKEWLTSALSGFQSLGTIRSMVHDSRIIDAMRKLINTSWTGTNFVIQIDKEVLAVQKIHLLDESENSPLGCVEILGFCNTEEEYESFLQWFTPLTKDGRVIRD